MNTLPENPSPWSWTNPEKTLTPVGDFASIWSEEILRSYRDNVVAAAAANMAASLDNQIMEASKDGKNLGGSVVADAADGGV